MRDSQQVFLLLLCFRCFCLIIQLSFFVRCVVCWIYNQQFNKIHFHPLLTLELVTVWVIMSPSLLVFTAVLVLLNVCLMVGLLVFFKSIVTLVLGDPIPEMSAVILCENNQKSPAPIPGLRLKWCNSQRGCLYLFTYIMDYLKTNSNHPLLVLELVTVWVMVSPSLLVFTAVLVLLSVWRMVGLLVFFKSIVMFVLGDPMLEISAVTLWENNQNRPTPIPEGI